MKKHPDEQLDLDFDSPAREIGFAAQYAKPNLLSLVHSQPKTSCDKNTRSDREKILSEVVSYARKLSW